MVRAPHERRHREEGSPCPNTSRRGDWANKPTNAHSPPHDASNITVRFLQELSSPCGRAFLLILGIVCRPDSSTQSTCHLTDIDANDISRYQHQRLKDKAAPKTINFEVGTIRGILRRHRLWANLQPAVLLALNTSMRYSELRLLRWNQADLERRTVRVGKSKTEAGTGRVIPLNEKATEVLKFWAEQFPKREDEHFIFPSERYGAGGNRFEPTVYNIDPTKAINSWKEAWESVKEDTGASRFASMTSGTPSSRDCLA